MDKLNYKINLNGYKQFHTLAQRYNVCIYLSPAHKILCREHEFLSRAHEIIKWCARDNMLWSPLTKSCACDNEIVSTRYYVVGTCDLISSIGKRKWFTVMRSKFFSGRILTTCNNRSSIKSLWRSFVRFM
jgi:hypothetical protein